MKKVITIIVIVLVNRQQVMGHNRANTGRNAILVIGAVISIWLSVVKLPGYVAMIF